MLEHALAHPADDETVRLMAILLTNATLALNLMRELVSAQHSRRAAKVAKIRKRLDRVLAPRRREHCRAAILESQLQIGG